MRKFIILALVACLTFSIAGTPIIGTAYAGQYRSDPYRSNPYQYSSSSYYYEPYWPEQLDNLLAPIALYPDPLLAQVLVAATYPDQIQDAARYVRRYGTNSYRFDTEPWDVSVRAVSHYPSVLYMMNDNIDWTAAVGQAYVNQPADMIASIQNLRRLARTQGNLFSTPQQQVLFDRGYIQILPAQPRYIFVPTYDPGAIYTRRIYSGNSWGGLFSFGVASLIGSWLNYDLDWNSRRVVYDGWTGTGWSGSTWRQRSLPYVTVNNYYVNNTYRSVPVNRIVIERPVNYQNVDRFNSVHRDVRFDNRARAYDRNRTGQPAQIAPPVQPNVQPSYPSSAQERVQQERDRARSVAPAQAPAAVPQQPAQQAPQVEQRNNGRQNNNDNGGGQRNGQQGGFDRGRGHQEVAPQAQPQPQQEQRPAQEQRQPVQQEQRRQPPQQDQRPAQERQQPAQEERQQPPAAQEQRPAQEQAQPAQQERQSQQDRGNRGNGNGNGGDNGNGNGKEKKDKSQ